MTLAGQELEVVVFADKVNYSMALKRQNSMVLIGLQIFKCLLSELFEIGGHFSENL